VNQQIGQGNMVARLAVDLRAERRTRERAERLLEVSRSVRDQLLLECEQLRQENDSLGATIAALNDLCGVLRRRARRAEDRSTLQDPLVVYREDDGEIDTPAGGAR
jgi:hypothetical protein